MSERSIQYLPVDELVPALENPKAHDLETLKASLRRFGYVEPVVRDDRTGRLVAGHGRTEELTTGQAAGLDPPEGVRVEDGRWLVPVVVGWTSANDDEAAAAVVALNRIGERGGWQGEALVDLLEKIGATPLALEGVGFEPEELDEMLGALGSNEEVLAVTPGETEQVRFDAKKADTLVCPSCGHQWLLQD